MPAHEWSTPASLRDSVFGSFWLDQPGRPAPTAALRGNQETDLAIVGGGFSGLWAAVVAKTRDPDRDVVLVEADTVGHAATGRNGGFLSSSLTHGLGNGLARFPGEVQQLEALGAANFDEIARFVEQHQIDCALETTGTVAVARHRHELEGLADARQALLDHGHEAVLLDQEQVQAELCSPRFLGGLWQQSGEAIVDPARLAWGLLDVAGSLGVRIHEGTPARSVEAAGGHLLLRLGGTGQLAARRLLLCTNAFPSLVRRHRRYVVPVYDYVLVSEPLSAAQRAEIGWARRQGFADASNLFHYYRLTADDRVLWGGYDAAYHFGSRMEPSVEDSPEIFAGLARRFVETFPMLGRLRFTHRWSGAIDTSTRFSVAFATAFGGRAVSPLGYTGLGVGASRFGASTGLDLVDGLDTPATRLRAVQTLPLPFPPEPLRWLGIELTKRASAAEDRTGRRGIWLRTMDRLGLGFDS